MADSFTTSLRLLKQEDQGNTNIWGNNYNQGMIDLVEEAIAGVAAVDVTLGNVTLTTVNGGSDTSRPRFLRVTGTPGGDRTITVPSLWHLFIVSNLTSPGFDVEIRTVGFSGYVVAPGETVMLFSDPVIGGIVVEPFDAARFYKAGELPFTQFTFDISNATAGDTTVTADFIKQGMFTYVRLPAISTTISTTDFALIPQVPIDFEFLPDGSADAEYSFCVEDAGTPVNSFLRIVAGIQTTWVIRDTTLAAYTAAATRTTQFARTMCYPSQTV